MNDVSGMKIASGRQQLVHDEPLVDVLQYARTSENVLIKSLFSKSFKQILFLLDFGPGQLTSFQAFSSLVMKA
jgi:hypothetical protein